MHGDDDPRPPPALRGVVNVSPTIDSMQSSMLVGYHQGPLYAPQAKFVGVFLTPPSSTHPKDNEKALILKDIKQLLLAEETEEESKEENPKKQEKTKTELEENADEDKVYLSSPPYISKKLNVVRQDLVDKIDGIFKLGNCLVSVGGIIAIGKHFLVDSYCNQNLQSKYQYIFWFDKAYKPDEVKKKLNSIKEHFSFSEDLKYHLVFREVKKKISRDKKLLLVLNCGYYKYDSMEKVSIFDAVKNDRKVDMILISHISQDLPQKQSLIIGKVGKGFPKNLVEAFSVEENLGWSESFCESVAKACLYYPTLIVQYCRYLKIHKQCKEHEKDDEFPFPFLIKHRSSFSSPIRSPIFSDPKLLDLAVSPSIASTPSSTSSSDPGSSFRDYLDEYSRPNLYAKITYDKCLKSAIELIKLQIKKDLTERRLPNICVFNLISQLKLFEQRTGIDKAKLEKACEAELEKACEKENKDLLSGQSIVDNFIETAEKYFLICSNKGKDDADDKDDKIVLEDIILSTLKYLNKSH